MYVFGRETPKLLLSASRKDFWLLPPLSMLEVNTESIARKGRQLQGPISYIPLSPGNFPIASPYLFSRSPLLSPAFPTMGVRMVTRLLNFCLLHPGGMVGAKHFGLSSHHDHKAPKYPLLSIMLLHLLDFLPNQAP